MASTSPITVAEPTVGVLCYDPNPTTAKLATAGLRLAGYEVFNANNEEEAIRLCKLHGPGGDRTVVAILLDASVSPATSASLLRALAQLPGASELPGILLVSRENPTPIPGAEDLPSLKRPFSTPALVKIVKEVLEDHRPIRGTSETDDPPLILHLRKTFSHYFPELELSPERLNTWAAELAADVDVPVVPQGVTLQGSLTSTCLDAVLDMLGNTGALGVLAVQRGTALGRLHLDQARIRLADAQGTEEDLKLGRFVVEGGFMRDEELEAFVIGRDPEGRPLGTRLVEGGFLSPADLAQVLVNQAREVTCHLLTWQDGTFTFTPTTELHPMAAAAAAQGKVELLIAEALLDGLRRLDEAAIMGPHMAEMDDVYMRLDEQIVRFGRDTLTRDELSVLELVNARNSVKEIARRTRTGAFAVASVLYRLTKANLVRRRITPVTV